MPGRYTGGNQYRYGFNGHEKDDEVNGITGSSYTAEFWQYDSRLGRRWNQDPLNQFNSNYSAFGNNPILNIDPSGAWVPGVDGDGNSQLIAEENDNMETLTNYLDNIGVEISEEQWNDLESQVKFLQENVESSIEGYGIGLDDHEKFSNLTGKFLMSRMAEDGKWNKTDFPGYNCSPTTFNRCDKAVEEVQGVDVLGILKWSNDNYRHWQKSSKSTLSKEQQKYFDLGAVGVIVYNNLGYEVSLSGAKSGNLLPGAVLNLQAGTGGHSVFFKEYTYDSKGDIDGFSYWETYGEGSSKFNNPDDWQIRKAANLY